jgi:hypothetical protein
VLKMGIMQALPDLLDEAERRAGRECDNLSAVAMTWEEHFPATRPEEVPARGRPPDSAAVLPRQPDATETQNDYLSDDEIELAIARIRSAIKRQTDDKT